MVKKYNPQVKHYKIELTKKVSPTMNGTQNYLRNISPLTNNMPDVSTLNSTLCVLIMRFMS